MKICIPIDKDNGKKSKVYNHFGSAPYFAIYDIEKDEFEVRQNSNQHHIHGACHPLAVLKDKNINAIVCAGMGARAVQLLFKAGIKAYRTDASTVEEVLERLKHKELPEITVKDACTGHSCH